VSAIAAQVDPAVVDIDTTLAQGGGAAGTGIVLTPSGLVLTNNHVIENATTIDAQIAGTGRVYDATVLGYSISDDVALVQLKGASGLKTATTASAASVAAGQQIVCLGNALGTGGTPAAVGGTITALDQTITAGSPGTASETLHGLIQMNAPIQSGDSGGPVVDSGARVIGMDTAASVNNGFGEQSGGGQAYAIPLGTALAIADQIKSGQGSANIHIGPRALLGVEVSDGGSSGGAVVQQVEPGSPAASAGISQGDTIVSVSGASVSSASDLSNVLVGHKPGDAVTVKWVVSSGTTHSATVHLTAGPPA
jgi:S1-C subfamily serine protease